MNFQNKTELKIPLFGRVFLTRPSEQKNGKVQKTSPNRVILAMTRSEAC